MEKDAVTVTVEEGDVVRDSLLGKKESKGLLWLSAALRSAHTRRTKHIVGPGALVLCRRRLIV